MKKSFKFMAFAMIAVFSLAFVSCSDDDDDIDKAQLVGKWINTKVEWKDSESSDSETYDDDRRYLILDSDGTGMVNPDNLFENEIDDIFNWKVSGNKLTILESDGDKEVYKITRITNNELVLRWDDNEDGYTVVEIHTFKKAVDTED